MLLYEMLSGELPFALPQSTDLTSSSQQELYHRILNDEIRFACDWSHESRLILRQFLEKQPGKRLGSSKDDFIEIKCHPFFKGIDWDKLYTKELEPPFRPLVSSDVDTCYFEKEFTGENVQLTPPDANTRLDLDNEINYFDSFSFYGSRSSLFSHQSHVSMKSVDNKSAKSSENDSSNQALHKSATASSEYLPSPHSSMRMRTKFSSESSQPEDDEETKSVHLACNAFPNIIQFSDSNGQLYQSKSFFSENNSESIRSHAQNNNIKASQQEFSNISSNYKYLQN